MTAAEVHTPTPLQRSIKANHRIATELGQLAALLATQIKSAENGPAMVPRASVGGRLAMSSSELGLTFGIEFPRSSAPLRSWRSE